MTTKKKVTTQHHGATPTDPLAQRAQQATDLKYGPQLSALKSLGADTQQSYLQGLGQARTAGQSIVNATNESAGGLADFLARAGMRGQDLAQSVNPAAFTPKLANEAAIAQRNQGLDVQSVAARLANTKVRAQEAAQFQQQHLYGQYQQDLGKINGQASGLADQAGQYAQSVYQSLLADKAKSDLEAKKIASAARNAALQRGTSRLIAGVDANGQVIPGSPKEQQLQTQADAVQQRKDAAAKKTKDAATKAAKGTWLNPQQQNTYVAAIKTVAGLVRDQVGKPVTADVTLPNGQIIKAGSVLTSHAARQLLTTKANPLGQAFDPNQINAAFDLAQLGGLSPVNVDALHHAKVKVNGFLPLDTPAKAAKRAAEKKAAQKTLGSILKPFTG